MSSPTAPTVARASAIMFASLFLSRILGLLRVQVMVWSFGRNEITDAYRWSYAVPDLMFFLIAGGALSSAFIPVFSEYLHTDKREEAWKVFSTIVTLMSIVVIAAIIVAWVYALPFTHLVAPGAKADSVRELIATMSRIVLPAQFAFLIGGLMFGTLYAHHRFAVPGLGPNIYNLFIIFGALVISQFVSPGIIGMSWGALIGAFVGNFFLPMLAMRSIKPIFRPSLDLSHPGVRKVLILMLPVILGLSLPGAYGLIMQAFSSYFAHGTATAIDTSNQLMQAPLAIFGQSLAIAVFPTLSMHFAKKEMKLYATQLAATCRTVIFITLPISALMIVLSPDIVSLLFQYGSKFGGGDTAVVAACLQMFGIGVVGWCLHPVLMRGFFAIQNSAVPIAIGTATTGLFFTLCYSLVRTPLGYLALPLSSSISAIVLAFALIFFLRRKVTDLNVGRIAETALKAAAAAAAMALLLWMGNVVVPAEEGVSGKLLSIVRLVGFGLGGVWIYFGIAKLLKMPEADYVSRTLAKLDRRKNRKNHESGGGPPPVEAMGQLDAQITEDEVP